MEFAEAYALICRAIDSGHVPGGYLIVGDTRGNARDLVMHILSKLYPESASRIKDDDSRSYAFPHPDVAILEPEGRSRTIKTETLRDRIVEPMATTSFSGGWKVGVIVGADRMQQNAANSFLKSLEEPTPKTLFMLLTDQPDAILPTIISRCQRVDLRLPPGILEGDFYDRVAEIFRAKGMDGVFAKGEAARRLSEVLTELKDSVEDEEVPLARKSFYRTIMSFVREWMVAAKVPRHLAFRNVEAVEEAYARSERFIPDEPVLSFMMDKITFPEG